ncbi:MAG: histidine phosphatase family protein [Phycisphaerales bacterium]|nr:histidine phosphatase family protein [Phycisphaerales bacterium]
MDNATQCQHITSAAPARLWLVRHGQTDWNAQRRIQGHTPTELNEIGRQQAAKLALWFGRRPFQAIWSSDLPRARQTAEPIAAALGLTVCTTPLLRERHLGPYEGKTWNEVSAMRIGLNGPQQGDLADWTGVPHVESDQALWHRIRDCLSDISQQHANQDVLIITHGGVIKHSVWHILGLPVGAPRRFPLANGITAVVQRRSDGFYLLSLFDTALIDGDAAATDTASAIASPSA